MSDDDKKKLEARGHALRALAKMNGSGPPSRPRNEGHIEALFYTAATLVATTDDLGFDEAVIRGLVDQFWETADEWVAEQKRIRN